VGVCREAARLVALLSNVTLITDGCLEFGSCRIIYSEHLNVDWE
jgi:ferredoxin-like protein FixX